MEMQHQTAVKFFVEGYVGWGWMIGDMLGLRTIVVFERALHAGLSTLISANEPLMPVNAACLRTLFPFSALSARRRGMAVNGYALKTWKWV